ncbi:hypothetical protein BGZ80_008114 [Entomortierella chlamydospora]|uniref:Uncharacterized protein n=1 Tax=Entomortierella chlamydospora TaxID=101097 RepID=A0A9P6MYZ6_9FUNG|nr:hypothetical protein BGZ79_005668 [Entomortierella chlamydospora]KAG0017621.1 hypothetical protein BGZ80_008114 [Entomortierella chlamydospora]
MAKTACPPNLKIKTLFTPSTFVCLLALSLCSTPTHALPITPSSSSSTPSADLPVDAKISSPFRTVSRPITIQIDLSKAPSSESYLSSEESLSLLIQHAEQHEKFLRESEQDPEEFARLQQEQDELEKIEQDRDQLLDNEEEEQLDRDPETVRRRQEESLGLWMTDADFEAISQEPSSDEIGEVLADKGSRFDLYAEDFTEEATTESGVWTSRSRSFLGSDQKNRLQRQQPSEEEMLQWPVINLAQFEDRQDEI